MTNKMTKKEMAVNLVKEFGAKEVNGVYEMTNAQFNRMCDEINGTWAICSNKKDETIKAVYDISKKNRYVVVKIVPAKTKKAKKTAEGSKTFRKEKGNGYVVYYKFDGQEVVIDDTMTTCSEIKAFIKFLHHEAGKLEMLQIYKMGENYEENKDSIIKTRLSAWRG